MFEFISTSHPYADRAYIEKVRRVARLYCRDSHQMMLASTATLNQVVSLLKLFDDYTLANLKRIQKIERELSRRAAL